MGCGGSKSDQLNVTENNNGTAIYKGGKNRIHSPKYPIKPSKQGLPLQLFEIEEDEFETAVVERKGLMSYQDEGKLAKASIRNSTKSLKKVANGVEKDIKVESLSARSVRSLKGEPNDVTSVVKTKRASSGTSLSVKENEANILSATSLKSSEDNNNDINKITGSKRLSVTSIRSAEENKIGNDTMKLRKKSLSCASLRSSKKAASKTLLLQSLKVEADAVDEMDVAKMPQVEAKYSIKEGEDIGTNLQEDVKQAAIEQEDIAEEAATLTQKTMSEALSEEWEASVTSIRSKEENGIDSDKTKLRKKSLSCASLRSTKEAANENMAVSKTLSLQSLQRESEVVEEKFANVSEVEAKYTLVEEDTIAEGGAVMTQRAIAEDYTKEQDVADGLLESARSTKRTLSLQSLQKEANAIDEEEEVPKMSKVYAIYGVVGGEDITNISQEDVKQAAIEQRDMEKEADNIAQAANAEDFHEEQKAADGALESARSEKETTLKGSMNAGEELESRQGDTHDIGEKTESAVGLSGDEEIEAKLDILQEIPEGVPGEEGDMNAPDEMGLGDMDGAKEDSELLERTGSTDEGFNEGERPRVVQEVETSGESPEEHF